MGSGSTLCECTTNYKYTIKRVKIFSLLILFIVTHYKQHFNEFHLLYHCWKEMQQHRTVLYILILKFKLKLTLTLGHHVYKTITQNMTKIVNRHHIMYR